MNWFNVGKIVNTHGLQGEVRVVSCTDFANERYKIGNILVACKDNQEISVTVKTHRKHKSFDLLTFVEYTTINDVEKLRDYTLKVPNSQLGRLEENEYYFHEIIGCTVYTDSGEEIGKIKEILTPGANDVWVVQRQKKEILIPYIADIVKEISIVEKKIIIIPMQGLLDEN